MTFDVAGFPDNPSGIQPPAAEGVAVSRSGFKPERF